MAEILGFNDMRALALPTGVDATELTRWATAEGTTYDIVIGEIINALTLANGALLNDPIYAGMMSLTTEPMAEYPSGVSNDMVKRVEHAKNDTRRTKSVGHMLQIEGFEYPMGWTADYLENARMYQIRLGIREGINAVRSNFQYALLNRFFSSAENQINGGSGYDMPLANASSTVTYVPKSYDGQDFASSHTHFDRNTDDATGRATSVANGVDHLIEHGIMPPYDMIVPLADADLWTALASTSPKALFVEPQRAPIVLGANTAIGAPLPDERYIGYISTARGIIRVWTTARLPENYMGLYKTYGANAMGNPLLVRYKPRRGSGAFLLAGKGFQLFPLEEAIIQHDFGVGISEGRLNGYASYFAAAGDYVSPTISN